MRRALICIVVLLTVGIFIRWIVEEHNRASHAAGNIKEHWDRVNARAQLENDELRVQNDQLEIDIMRKKGKRPSRDQLKKLELDQATLEATKSLIRAQQAVDDLPSQ